MKVIKAALFLVIFSISFLPQSKATHSAGMEIFYRWVSDSTYEFTLIFYRNCEGFTASAPSSAYISASSASQFLTGSIFASRLPTFGTGVPPLQPPNIYECLDTNYCVEEYVYRGTWVSPKRANDWIFSYTLCCLPVTLAPTNMQNGALYNECGLNNLDFPDSLHKNRSPIYHNRRPNHPGYLNDTIFNPPNVSVCEGRNVRLDESTREYDGDLVKYSRFWPQTNGGANLGYINGWSDSIPLPYKSPGFVIDSNTGIIDFIPGTPSGTSFYLTGVMATEYRLDTTVSPAVYKEIGFVKRNLMITIEDSISCPGGLFTFSDTSGTGIDTNQIVIECPQSTFDINFTADVVCSSIDTNASCVKMWHASSGVPIPVKNLWGANCNISKNSSKITFTPDTAMYADTFKLVFVKGTDGNTIKTSCYDELEPYADTLTIIFTDPPTGVFLGDELALGSFSPVIEIDCHRSEFYLNLSEPVKCSSIDPTGADFQFFDGPTSLFNLLPISQVDPVCSGGRTQKLKITTAPLDAGTYIIRSSRAAGLSSFETVCGTPWPHDSILIQSKGLYPKLGNDTTYCIEDSTFYMALHPGNFHKYLWDNSDTLRYRPISDSGTYWVAVFNKYGCVNIDTIVVSAIVCNTGFEESNHQSIKIFPNPTSNLIYIQFEEGIDDGVIELYNTLGDRLISQRGNENERSVSISLKEFESGVYFLKVRLRNDVIRTERIIYKGN